MSTDDPYIGERIADGGYEIVASIGGGEFGHVYRAVQEGTGTEVAVKILHIKYALDRCFVERFKREVKLLRSLCHPNTVRILGDGEMEDGPLYIVMELLQGRSLDVALEADGPWPLERAISMAMRVAYALEEAHRLEIVHRNLKPGNIFLVRRSDGVEIPRVLDFGIAKVGRNGDSDGTGSAEQEGDLLAMPAQMSPEQSFGEWLDGRADIYSLAVILYELLTGHLPFEDSRSDKQITRYLDDPIPIDERVDGLMFPPELWQVLSRALQKLPEDRFSTALELAEALAPLIKSADCAPGVVPAPPIQPEDGTPNDAPAPGSRGRSKTATSATRTPVPPRPSPRTPVPPRPSPTLPPAAAAPSRARLALIAGTVLVIAAVLAALLLR